MVRLKGIKNIVFDFGGVLIDLDKQACIDAFARLGIPQVADYMTLYGHEGPFGAMEQGSIDMDGFRDGLRELFKVSLTNQQINDAWGAFLLKIPEAKMRMVHELSKKYRVFILSNTNPIHIDRLSDFDKAGYPVKECFEKLYLSYQLKLCKPSREIFEYVLRDAGLKPEETLFVDDGPANCKAAEELGFHTYQPAPFEDFSGEFFQPDACVATLGFFDGVHRGHRFLIDETKQVAKEQGLPSMVISFWPHPRMVVHSDFCPQLLTDETEKVALLAATGIDYVRTITFDRELSGFSARQFMEEILKDELHVKTLVIGFDHRFGNKREDGFEDYVRYGKELGIEVCRARPYFYSEASGASDKSEEFSISSSLIRRCLLAGKIEEANTSLGYLYSLKGEVVGGHQIGQKLGFPTANIFVSDPNKLIPAFGVYAVWVSTGDKRYKGMLNIGRRPTLQDDSAISIEVHLLHFEGDLYGKQITVAFVQRFRQEKSFPDLDALAAQLEKDKCFVEEVLQ